MDIKKIRRKDAKALAEKNDVYGRCETCGHYSNCNVCSYCSRGSRYSFAWRDYVKDNADELCAET